METTTKHLLILKGIKKYIKVWEVSMARNEPLGGRRPHRWWEEEGPEGEAVHLGGNANMRVWSEDRTQS